MANMKGRASNHKEIDKIPHRNDCSTDIFLATTGIRLSKVFLYFLRILWLSNIPVPNGAKKFLLAKVAREKSGLSLREVVRNGALMICKNLTEIP